MAEYRVLGTRPIRPDGVEKVTGRARYGADVHLPGLLHGKVLRSPLPHARIRRLDVSRAQAHPGVFAVITAADMPELTSDRIAEMGESAIGLKYASQLVLAREKVFYRAHAVAAVAAVNPHVAEEALGLIEVEYEPLPVVEDALEAMRPDAPLLHEDLFTREVGGGRSAQASNVAAHIQHVRGDVAQGFAEADVIVEREFRTQMVHQGYIEPQSATAQVAEDGRITIWCSSQGSFSIRDQVARLLQRPAGLIRVIPMEIGGGFGGKTFAYLEPLAVLLAEKAGRPVKLTMTRAEVFQATGPGSPTYIRLRLGAKRTGEFVAAEAVFVYDAGAFPGSPVGAACVTGLSPYRIPHLKIDGYDVVTNKPRVQAYRAPGATPAAFAVESVIDELAQRLGRDPVELRLQNAVVEGDRMTNGVVFNRIGFREVLQAVLNHPHYRSPLPPGPFVGRGVACGFWQNGRGTSSVHLTFNPDGTVNLIVGSIDLSGTRASLAMMAAEELGLEPADVLPLVGDTASVGPTDVSGGSRTTYSTGVAVWKACQEAKAELRRHAARLLETEPERVELVGTRFQVQGEPERWVAAKRVAAILGRTNGAFVARGVSGGLQMAAGFGAHIADVRVDPETGKVEILRYTCFQDVGLAVHPAYAEGQLQGGAAQGIGWALTEGYDFQQGVMRNPTFLDYRMPTAVDVPLIDTVLVEVPAADGPYGVRGVGEVPIVPPPAALANAICRATGVRLTELPMTPERVWRALSSAGQQQSVAV